MKYLNSRPHKLVPFTLACFFLPILYAQDFDVQGDGTNNGNVIVESEYTGGFGGIGFEANSLPQANYGIGAKGTGGYRGLYGLGNQFTYSTRYGIYGSASGGSTGNRGVYGYASGTGAYAGRFSGLCYATGSFTGSDSRFKKNMTSLKNNLNLISQLEYVTFNYDTEKFPDMHFPAEQQTGFIAQEVKEILPELISTIFVETEFEESNEVKKGLKGEEYLVMNYTKLVPILIGGIKEQQEMIDELKTILVNEAGK